MTIRRAIITFIGAVIITLLIDCVVTKVNAAPVAENNYPTITHIKPQLPPIQVGGQIEANYLKAAFAAGLLGNSGNGALAQNIKDLLNSSSAKNKSWWKKFLNANACLSFEIAFKNPAVFKCASKKVLNNDKWTKAWKNTTGIIVECGGLAFFGSLKGGGWYGAGIATSGCLWTTAVKKAFK